MLFVDSYPGLAEPNRLLGALLVLIAGWYATRRAGALTPEVVLLGLFALWTTASGAVVAIDPEAFWRVLRQLVQSAFLFFAIAEISQRRRSGTLVLGSMMLLAVVTIAYSVASGEALTAFQAQDQRIRSVTSNANFAGVLALYGLMGAAATTLPKRSGGRRLWQWALVPGMLLLVAASGSRKAAIAVAAFLTAWALLAFGRQVRRRPLNALVVIAVGVALVVLAQAALDNTVLGTRFQRTAGDPRLDTTRYGLYAVGIRVFLSEPVTGVGLGGFGAASRTGMYSHSDYIEPLATTGLPGLLIYLGIYVCLWRRLTKAERAPRSAHERYLLGTYKAILIAMAVLGTGTPNFLSPFHWMVVGAITGHAASMTSARLRTPHAAERRSSAGGAGRER